MAELRWRIWLPKPILCMMRFAARMQADSRYWPRCYFASGNYMDQFWSAGGTKALDVVSFHGYPHHPFLDNSPETINDYVSTIKACMSRNGVSSAIWDTEGSYGNAAYGVTDMNSRVGWHDPFCSTGRTVLQDTLGILITTTNGGRCCQRRAI